MKSFEIRLPKLVKKIVWIGTYGGHYDIIVVALTCPRNKKCPFFGDMGALKIPDGSLSIDPSTWESWYGSLENLVELGVMRKLESGIYPITTDLTKWVKAEITLPVYNFQGKEHIFGLNIDSDGYMN